MATRRWQTTDATFASRPRPLTAGRIALAWLVVIGVDLFFNAGLFAGLFDQDKEPSLLPDDLLFRRIPAAYLALGVGVVALAWMLDKTGSTGRHALLRSAGSGATVGILGLGALWTALDISGLFVVAGIGVLIVQATTAGGILVSNASRRQRLVRGLLTFVILAVLGQVAANLL
ncbi:MAG: hypothetical protein OEX04_08620 [Acidimicrobiia bacterium]|nr:hypothetical protein [Acidimicrobiia bacterium]